MRNFCLSDAFSFAVLSGYAVLAAENPVVTEYRRVHLAVHPNWTAGATDWWLHRLHPEGAKVLAKGQLPTHAKHLTVLVHRERDGWFRS